jgi:hypothetical protein
VVFPNECQPYHGGGRGGARVLLGIPRSFLLCRYFIIPIPLPLLTPLLGSISSIGGLFLFLLVVVGGRRGKDGLLLRRGLLRRRRLLASSLRGARRHLSLDTRVKRLGGKAITVVAAIFKL